MKNKIADYCLPNDINYGLTPFDWAEKNLSFGRCENYETEFKAAFDPYYMPFLREPSEAIINPDVSECWVMKCSRAGVSENAILIPLRFMVARMKKPVLYVSGNQKSTEDFMETRIKRGFMLSEETEKEFNAARSTEHRIIFRGMDLNVAWPASTMAFKQSGYATIFLDEVSTYKTVEILDIIRKRTANWRHSTIVGISSPATEINRPSSEDPIFVEYDSGTRKLWMMRDENGQEFHFELSGIKWDQDAKDKKTGKWNLRRVAESAHYVTPSGAVITDETRMQHVRQEGAYWSATNPEAVKGRESYYVNSPMTPFKTGDFSHIAVRFLEAKSRGKKAMRAFFYEYMPEPVAELNEAMVSEGSIWDLQKRNVYDRMTVPMDDAVVITTVDTQDKYFVYTTWAMTQTRQALIDHGYETDKDRLEKNLNEQEFISGNGKVLKLTCCLIDTGGHRTHEVYQLCARNNRFIALKGDNGQSTSKIHPVKLSDVEGLPLRLLHPTYFKDEFSHALQELLGVEVLFHKDIDEDYVRQVTGEILVTDEKADRYGQHKQFWKKIRTNDFFDCSVYAFAARFICQHLIGRLGVERADSALAKYPDDEEKNVEPAKEKPIRKRPRMRVKYA